MYTAILPLPFNGKKVLKYVVTKDSLVNSTIIAEKSEGEWEDLVADTHYEFDSHEGVPSATLVINEATNDDHAKYMCYAENELGSANRTVLVRVIGKSKKFANTLPILMLNSTDKYAAVWPFVGICIEVVVLCAVILIFERRRTKKMLEDTDNDQQRNS